MTSPYGRWWGSLPLKGFCHVNPAGTLEVLGSGGLPLLKSGSPGSYRTCRFESCRFLRISPVCDLRASGISCLRGTMPKAHKPDEYTEGFGCGPCPKCGNSYTVRSLYGKIFGRQNIFSGKWGKRQMRGYQTNIHESTPYGRSVGHYVAVRCHCDPKLFHEIRGKVPVGMKKKSYGCGYEGSCLEFRRGW